MDAPRSEIPAWIRSRLGERSPGRAALRVLRAVGTHPREMSYASTAAAAELAGVNVATVVRAAQMLGVSGWPALRSEIRSRFLAGLSASQVLHEHGPMHEADASGGGAPQGVALATLRQDLQNLRGLSALLDQEQITRTAQMLCSARVSLVLGSGSFAAPGLQLAHLAATIGHDIRLHRVGGSALYNAVSLLRPGDCLVVFHIWRSPRELVNAVQVASDGGVHVILVTDQLSDGLTGAASEVLRVPSEGSSMFPSLVGAITTVQAVIAEMVAIDPAGAATASDRAEWLWRTFDIFPPPGDVTAE